MKNYNKWGCSRQSGYVPELYAKVAARRKPQEKIIDSTEEDILCLSKPVACLIFYGIFYGSYFYILNREKIWGEY